MQYVRRLAHTETLQGAAFGERGEQMTIHAQHDPCASTQRVQAATDLRKEVDKLERLEKATGPGGRAVVGPTVRRLDAVDGHKGHAAATLGVWKEAPKEEAGVMGLREWSAEVVMKGDASHVTVNGDVDRAAMRSSRPLSGHGTSLAILPRLRSLVRATALTRQDLNLAEVHFAAGSEGAMQNGRKGVRGVGPDGNNVMHTPVLSTFPHAMQTIITTKQGTCATQ